MLVLLKHNVFLLLYFVYLLEFCLCSLVYLWTVLDKAETDFEAQIYPR